MNDLESDIESHSSIDTIIKYPICINSNIMSPLFFRSNNPTYSYISTDIILENV